MPDGEIATAARYFGCCQIYAGGNLLPVPYSGAAPGMVAGVVQINFQVPEDAAGLTYVTVVAGNRVSNPAYIVVAPLPSPFSLGRSFRCMLVSFTVTPLPPEAGTILDPHLCAITDRHIAGDHRTSARRSLSEGAQTARAGGRAAVDENLKVTEQRLDGASGRPPRPSVQM